MFNKKHKSRMLVSLTAVYPNSTPAAVTGTITIMCPGVSHYRQSEESSAGDNGMNTHVLWYEAPCLKTRQPREESHHLSISLLFSLATRRIQRLAVHTHEPEARTDCKDSTQHCCLELLGCQCREGYFQLRQSGLLCLPTGICQRL